MHDARTTSVAATVLSLLAALAPAHAQAPRSPTPAPVAAPVRAVPVASGLERPWAVAFLPDGRALVTEKAGRLRVVGPDGAVSAPLAGVPVVDPSGQGGLLDVALDPRFAENRMVYLSYAEAGAGGAGGGEGAAAGAGGGPGRRAAAGADQRSQPAQVAAAGRQVICPAVHYVLLTIRGNVTWHP